MVPDGLWDEHIKWNHCDPTVEVFLLHIDDRFFVLCQRADKQDDHPEQKHRAGDLQRTGVLEDGPNRRLNVGHRRISRFGQ